MYSSSSAITFVLRDYRQISLLLLSIFVQINKLPFTLKIWQGEYYRGILILSLPNDQSKIWRWSVTNIWNRTPTEFEIIKHNKNQFTK